MASTAFLWVNGTLAFRFARHRGPWLPVTFERRSATVRTLPATLPELLASLHLPWRFLIAAVAIVLGVLMAAGEIENWDAVLRFIHQVPYGQRDPLFGKDIGFYLFSLPAYVALKNWLLLALVLSALLPAPCIGRTATSYSTADASGCHPQPQRTAPSSWVSSSR